MRWQVDHKIPEALLFKPWVLDALRAADAPAELREALERWPCTADLGDRFTGVWREAMEHLLRRRSRPELLADLVGGRPETKKAVARAFQEAWRRIGFRKWGELHFLQRQHPLEGRGPFRNPLLPKGGDYGTLDPGLGQRVAGRWVQTKGAVYRMIVRLGKQVEMWTAMPGASPDRRENPRADALRLGEYLAGRYRRLQWKMPAYNGCEQGTKI